MKFARVVIVSLLLVIGAMGGDKRSDKDFVNAVLRSYRNAAGADSGANSAEYIVETKDRRYTLIPAGKFSLHYSILYQKPPGTQLLLFLDSKKNVAIIRLGGRESRYSVTRIEMLQ